MQVPHASARHWLLRTTQIPPDVRIPSHLPLRRTGRILVSSSGGEASHRDLVSVLTNDTSRRPRTCFCAICSIWCYCCSQNGLSIFYQEGLIRGILGAERQEREADHMAQEPARAYGPENSRRVQLACGQPCACSGNRRQCIPTDTNCAHTGCWAKVSMLPS